MGTAYNYFSKVYISHPPKVQYTRRVEIEAAGSTQKRSDYAAMANASWSKFSASRLSKNVRYSFISASPSTRSARGQCPERAKRVEGLCPRAERVLFFCGEARRRVLSEGFCRAKSESKDSSTRPSLRSWLAQGAAHDKSKGRVYFWRVEGWNPFSRSHTYFHTNILSDSRKSSLNHQFP